MSVRKPLPPPKPPPDPLERWNLLDVADLATELPPIPWVCEPLGLAPGAVSLVAGYGYSRKTMALQSLGLSVASGRPVWGLWSVRKGAFVHLDYEQGRRLTQERYQRLARGLGFEISDLPKGSIRVGSMPRAYLDEDGVFDEVCALVGSATFVLVDSLRAAFPRADENSSEIRAYLDVLSRVSERTGAAIAVIHHARKPNAQNGGTATHAIRGSSALFDACQSVYVFEGEKDTPTRVHHQKDRVRGTTLEEFGLTSEDVGRDDNARWGLVVRHLEVEQIDAAASRRAESREDSVVESVATKIVELIGPHGFKGSRIDARARIGVVTRRFDAAWSKLVNEGIIVRDGNKHEPRWVLCSDNDHSNHSSITQPSLESGVIDHSLTPPLGGSDRSHGLSDAERSLDDGNLFRGPQTEWWED